MNPTQKFEALTSFWFWLAFWGNAFTCIFSTGILWLTAPPKPPSVAEENPNLLERMQALRIHARPLTYILGIWAVAMWAAIRGLEAFVYSIQGVDWKSSVNQMLVGLMFMAVWHYQRYGTGAVLLPEHAKKATHMLIVGLISAFAIMGFLGFRLSLRRSNDLQQENNQLRKAQITQSRETQASYDTLTSQVKGQDSTNKAVTSPSR